MKNQRQPRSLKGLLCPGCWAGMHQGDQEVRVLKGSQAYHAASLSCSRLVGPLLLRIITVGMGLVASSKALPLAERWAKNGCQSASARSEDNLKGVLEELVCGAG